MSRFAEQAPPKINLTLRVLGRRADGYHELDSLVVFGSGGDRLVLDVGEKLDLETGGPFAPAIDTDNLVLKIARRAMERWPDLRIGRFRLEKNLPVAAGLGGGSADAAAAVRLLWRANPACAGDPGWREIAASAGADIPVCLEGRATFMSGIGERVEPVARMPALFAVLANPGVSLATADVFRALQAAPAAAVAAGERRIRSFADAGALFSYLTETGNDLEAPAMRLCPVIADVKAALAALPQARLARMSGSGATCFALFETEAEAAAAARELAHAQPGWWLMVSALR